ncbi:flagellar motor protein MotB [Rhizobium sp. CFBP 8762]|uniref:flagellar motor protein MotB n=1 Tax=Rhizobium sp. CFBP 8762 TaxID=2775279 RepID=UPI0017836704|nr:flagellar motor protein MotB [Rhizobium sp. CFBP 8762]MBD8553455.1 flagellar motor protein MotB [Rhizobium sp. CFBP 8762]
MSDNEGHHHGKNEIIIIKRHNGNHDGHHGGAWKIAYADFMTAMMAFFLVMWLVNAANEETKASVASYFNPMKLTDAKPSERGLKKPVEEAKGEQLNDKSKTDGKQFKSGGEAKKGDDLAATSGEETTYSEADFFDNPYAVLAEIAQDTGLQANISKKGEGGAALSGPSTGASGGEAYRDPFDPDFWTKQVSVAQARPDATTSEDLPDTVLPSEDKALKDDLKDAAQAKPPVEVEAEQAEKNAADLQAEIAKALGAEAGRMPEGVVVKPSEGGLLVSVSEQVDTPMFDIGSALPKRDLVIAMEKIAKVLAERNGSVLIRGHTDARPFKAGEADNWRLSTDRAQSAYYMLVRGGLNENRITQVSGFADRRLQVPTDPLAPANRRIEILLQAEQK